MTLLLVEIHLHLVLLLVLIICHLTIRVGYTLPSKYAETLGFSNANFYVSGDNLLVWTKRAGFNAQTLDDTNSFVAGNNYIPMSTLTFGVKVQF